jgi:hypothetical protein
VARDASIGNLFNLYGTVGGRWRLKLFDRSRTQEFILEGDIAGRHFSGILAPLNEAPPARWGLTGLFGNDNSATFSVTLGSTTSAEPATTSIKVLASLRHGDYLFASPVPSPEPNQTPTPGPTPPPGSSPGQVVAPVPVTKGEVPPGAGFSAYALIGTWSELPATGSTPATGSFTAIRISKPQN